MNKHLLLASAIIFIFLLGACNGTKIDQPEPIPTFTPVAPLPTPTTAVPDTSPIEPTVPSPTAVSITPTAIPITPISQSEPQRIQFETGGTSAMVNGRLAGPGSDDYVLRALAGQLMTVSIDSPNSDVRLSIHGIDDGQPLSRADTGATYWRGTLPATQDYSLRAVYSGANTTYTMTIIIDPFPTNNGPVDRVVQFEPGTDAITLSGVTGASFASDIYRLNVQAGQTMFASVSSTNGQGQPSVTVRADAFGTISPDGVAFNQQEWAGQLPLSGEVMVVVNGNTANTPYVLDIRIINTQAEQIRFAPEATSTVINGRISANEVIVYALEADAGQEMTAQLSSPTGTAKLFVELTDRAAYLGFNASDNNRTWQGTLPQSGPYYLFVTAPSPQTFNLTVEIVTPPTPSAENVCPSPGNGQRLFADPAVNYCFVYPAGLTAAFLPDDVGVSIVGPPLDNSLEPAAVGMSVRAVELANGRSAEEVATDFINRSGGELGEVLLVGGETAVVVHNSPGLFPMRNVLLVHNDVVYHFSFFPDGRVTPATLPTMDQLYDQVLVFFRFTD